MSNLSRRDFLKLTRDGFLYLSGVLALGGLLRFLSFQTEPARKTDFDLGPAESYPFETRIVLSEIPALLIHTKEGFTAISLVCTHLGCTVAQSAGGFACPCHGSQFDSQGNVLNGPANKQLQPLRIVQTPDGNLHLHTN